MNELLPGWKVLYEYTLREWWEGWDTPSAQASANDILDELTAAGFVIVPLEAS